MSGRTQGRANPPGGRGGGGGTREYSDRIWVGMFRWDPEIVALFMTRKLKFDDPIYDKIN